MRTVETSLYVSEERTIHFTLPGVNGLRPGMYRAVVMIDDTTQVQTVAEPQKHPLQLNVFELDAWPADCRFRREDMYDDSGR